MERLRERETDKKEIEFSVRIEDRIDEKIIAWVMKVVVRYK